MPLTIYTLPNQLPWSVVPATGLCTIFQWLLTTIGNLKTSLGIGWLGMISSCIMYQLHLLLPSLVDGYTPQSPKVNYTGLSGGFTAMKALLPSTYLHIDKVLICFGMGATTGEIVYLSIIMIIFSYEVCCLSIYYWILSYHYFLTVRSFWWIRSYWKIKCNKISSKS